MRKKLLLTLVLLLLGSLPTSAAWTHTNGGTAKCTGGPGVCSASAFSSPLTNPSLIVVSIFNSNGTTATWSVTDTAGNTYVDCGTGNVILLSSSSQIQCFYALNTHTTASNVATMNLLTGVDSVDIIVADEYTGNATSSPVDVSHSNPNASSGSGSDNVNAGAMTTTTNGDLVYCYALLSSGNASAGTSFTQDSIQGTAAMSEHLVQNSAGAITATQTDSAASDPYGALAVAFKASGLSTTATVGGKAAVGGKASIQ